MRGHDNEVGSQGRWVRYYLARYRLTVAFIGLVILWVVTSVGVYHFEKQAQSSNITSFADSLWWGLVTLLTVGYGDRYPVTLEGRLLSSVLMLGGVVAIAIMTSKISSIYLRHVLLEGRHAVDLHKLNNHLVICGYKKDFAELIRQVLVFNPGLEPRDIVVVANMSSELIDQLKAAYKELRALKIIQGDFVQESVLRKARPHKARKVMILSDAAPSTSTGQPPSPEEADARVIMAAITLSKIAKNTLITAEILDAKLESHLKLSGVTEIIYSKEYSRLILGNASSGTGVSNVIYDLLNPHTLGRIETPSIDDQYVGMSYVDYKAIYESHNPQQVVVGILENTGNPQRMKELAIREAQKTASVSRLIENLKSVKQLQCNKPIFHPGAQYTIRQGSAAIVITGHNQEPFDANKASA